MNSMRQFLVVLFSLLICRPTNAQNNSAVLPGVWQGTSICQVKNSPCHDETVVYHISNGANDSSFIIKANKIVNGKEEEMGDIHFVFNSKTSQLHSTDYNAIWTFTLAGDKLSGTLVYHDALYRIINVTKKH